MNKELIKILQGDLEEARINEILQMFAKAVNDILPDEKLPVKRTPEEKLLNAVFGNDLLYTREHAVGYNACRQDMIKKLDKLTQPPTNKDNES